MKKIFAILLMAAVIFTMTACKFSSSSTSSFSVSTSVTGEDGKTETRTVTGEVDVSAGSDGVNVQTNTTDETTTN